MNKFSYGVSGNYETFANTQAEEEIKPIIKNMGILSDEFSVNFSTLSIAKLLMPINNIISNMESLEKWAYSQVVIAQENLIKSQNDVKEISAKDQTRKINQVNLNNATVQLNLNFEIYNEYYNFYIKVNEASIEIKPLTKNIADLANNILTQISSEINTSSEIINMLLTLSENLPSLKKNI
jgi:hypothetical protein